MPFTPTHIAVALPIAWLCRWRIPFSALAIGTMVSDIPVFYPTLMDYQTTHSMIGVLTHCTPVGVFAYYFYQAVVKRPLADLFPRSVTQRLRPWIDKPIAFSPLAVLAVFLCVALGAATHVVWDSFTHMGRWGVQTFPALQEIAIDYPQHPIRWYALLQHGSTLLLLPPMLLGFFIWVWKQPIDPRPMSHAQMPREIAWATVALMLIGAVLYCHVMRQHHPTRSWAATLGYSAKDSGAVILAIMVSYCLGMHYLWWRDRGRDEGGELECSWDRFGSDQQTLNVEN